MNALRLSSPLVGEAGWGVALPSHLVGLRQLSLRAKGSAVGATPHPIPPPQEGAGALTPWILPA